MADCHQAGENGNGPKWVPFLLAALALVLSTIVLTTEKEKKKLEEADERPSFRAVDGGAGGPGWHESERVRFYVHLLTLSIFS